MPHTHSPHLASVPIPITLHLNVSQQPTHCNTYLHYTLFIPHQPSIPVGRLNPYGWKQLSVNATILGIYYFGARIGYKGKRIELTIDWNLKTAEEDSAVATTDLVSKRDRGRLKTYAASVVLPDHYTVSPLGLANKADGSKRRIHHLSYPPTGTTFINAGIPENYGTIENSIVDNVFQTIQVYWNGGKLVKRDFRKRFPAYSTCIATRHTPAPFS